MQASGFGDVFGTGNGNRPGVSAVDAPLADMSGEGRSTPGGYCPVCNVSGKITAATFAACTTLSMNRIQCASDEYCGVEVRQRMQQITGLRIQCVKIEQCKAMTNRNFLEDDATTSTGKMKFTLCRPEASLQANPRHAPSLCSGCVETCASANDSTCIGSDHGGETRLNTNSETFETALGLGGDGRGVRRFWDNEAFIAAP